MKVVKTISILVFSLFFITLIFCVHKKPMGGPDIIVIDNVKKLPNGVPVGAETPASLSCIYGLTTNVPGCPINGTSALPNGGKGLTIAVTDGEDDPNAYQELTTFSSTFGLPILPLCSTGQSPCFKVAYVDGVVPGPATSKVDLTEHALDIEWAHAMAPQANIIMVESASFASLSDMLSAVTLAAQLVSANGGGIVSNSWSFDEFSTELSDDSTFQGYSNVIFIASSGDYTAPARYPSSSPYVISAGGTGIQRDGSGNFLQEVAWRNPSVPLGQRFSGASGGPSAYESRPFYQNSVSKIVGTQRGTPDISFEADPSPGVALFYIDSDSGPSGTWALGGGTSLASPALAGIIASANSGATTTAQELALIYTGAIKNYHNNWNDILIGNNGFPCLPGYDFATGLGTPHGYSGK